MDCWVREQQRQATASMGAGGNCTQQRLLADTDLSERWVNLGQWQRVTQSTDRWFGEGAAAAGGGSGKKMHAAAAAACIYERAGYLWSGHFGGFRIHLDAVVANVNDN